MEIFILLLVGVIIILVLSSFRKEVKKNMRIINKNVINIRKEINQMKNDGSPSNQKKEVIKTKESDNLKTIKPLEVSGQRLTQAKVIDLKVNDKINLVKAEQKEHKITTPKKEKKEEPITKKKVQEKKPRDYEKLIGENWLNKVGIAILVLGIGFFVKYAIDKNWIGEIGRVLIGISVGGILIGTAHFLRKKYHAFSSVLIGGGISVFYYTISIAYHDY